MASFYSTTCQIWFGYWNEWLVLFLLALISKQTDPMSAASFLTNFSKFGKAAVLLQETVVEDTPATEATEDPPADSSGGSDTAAETAALLEQAAQRADAIRAAAAAAGTTPTTTGSVTGGPSAPKAPESGTSLSPAAIAGIAVGGVVVLVGLFFLARWMRGRKPVNRLSAGNTATIRVVEPSVDSVISDLTSF